MADNMIDKRRTRVAMDEEDLALCIDYFSETEQRDPTVTELGITGTYWSEKVRHTTLNTVINSVISEDPMMERAYVDYLAMRKDLGQNVPVTLNDILNITGRLFMREAMSDRIDMTEDGEATVMISVEVDGETEPWLLTFSDKITGRAYPYAAMRVTGSADPISAETGTAEAAGEASEKYRRAGVPVGITEEVYHQGYGPARMEADVVLSAAPAVNVRRERPAPGDLVLLLGAPEEHRLQRFFRSSTASRMVKSWKAIDENGVWAAVSRLADGIMINMDAIGDDNYLMACVVAAENEKMFRYFAAEEDITCTKVAAVSSYPRLVINQGGQSIADIEREFLDSKGREKRIDIAVKAPGNWQETCMYEEGRGFLNSMRALAQDVRSCSRRGLTDRFDHSVGTSTVMMPLGGSNRFTPAQAMVHRLPVDNGSTEDCTFMSFGFEPYISEVSPYHGSYFAVIESVAKLIASGASTEDVFLTFREHYGLPGSDPVKWGRLLASALGAFEAQRGLGLASAGSRESMCGIAAGRITPPSLVSFAVTTGRADSAISPEFKKAGHRVVYLRPYTEYDVPQTDSLIRLWSRASEMISSGDAVAAYTPGAGGIAEAVMKMCFGNGIGFQYAIDDLKSIFSYSYGSLILELSDEAEIEDDEPGIVFLGYTCAEQSISFDGETAGLGELLMLYEGKLDSVFPVNVDNKAGTIAPVSYSARSWHTPVFKRSTPKVLIPVFPGTTGEYDSMRAVTEAGASADYFVIRENGEGAFEDSAARFADAIREYQIMMLPGCDFDKAAAFFRSDAAKEGVETFLSRQDGLICGFGSGARLLAELGLVPHGKICDKEPGAPEFMENTIGTHKSGIVRVRIASDKSPWLRFSRVGEIFQMPASFSYGKFSATEDMLRHLAGSGQIATQYVDADDRVSGDVRFNPGGSMLAAEAVTSPDGRVYAGMGRADRCASGLYRNVPGSYKLDLFENAVRYFKK